MHQRVEVGLAQDPELGIVDGDGALGSARVGDERLAAEGFPALDGHAPVERIRGRQQSHPSGLDDIETVCRLSVAKDRVAAFVADAEQPVGDGTQILRRKAAKDVETADSVGHPHELVAMSFDGDRVGDDSAAQSRQGAPAPLGDLVGSQTLPDLQILGDALAGNELDGRGGEGGRQAQIAVKLLARQHPDVGPLGGDRMVRVRGAGNEGMLTGGRPAPVHDGNTFPFARVRDRYLPLFHDVQEIGGVAGAVDRRALLEHLLYDSRGEVFDVLLGQVSERGNPFQLAERLLEPQPALTPQVVHDGRGLAQESTVAVDDIVQRDEQGAAEDAAHRQPVELPLRKRGTDQVDSQRREQRTASEGHEYADGAVVGAPDQGREGSERERAGAHDSQREGQEEQRIHHASLPRTSNLRAKSSSVCSETSVPGDVTHILRYKRHAVLAQ